MSIDDLKSLMDAFDPASLLPELDSLLETLASVMRVAVLAGPVILLIMGILYIIFSPREANYYFGYRCYFGMGSVDAWRYTQRIAGLIWGILGLVLTIVMVVISNGFAEKQTMEVLSSAVTCVLWEAGLIIVSCFAINTIVAIQFNSDGELRRRRAR